MSLIARFPFSEGGEKQTPLSLFFISQGGRVFIMSQGRVSYLEDLEKVQCG